MSPSVTFRVDATIPPTFTCAVFEKMTPLGLSKKTCPLAFNLPIIWLALLSNTRLTAIEDELG